MNKEEKLLERVVSAIDPIDEETKIQSVDLIANLLDIARKEEKANFLNKGVISYIESQINKIDQVIGKILDKILHNDELRKIESKWRGFHYLVNNSQTSEKLKIRLLPASKKEIEDDFDKSADYSQTAFFKKMYSSEYDTFGGKPNTYIVLDEYIKSTTADCKFLNSMSEIAAACHAPLFTAPSPQVFNMKKFSDIHNPRDLTKVFETVDKVKWNALREKYDSRYLCLCMPRVMARAPFDPEDNPCEGLSYKENVDPYDDTNFVWMNAAYNMATLVNKSYNLYSWPMSIRGVEGGGLVFDLPIMTYTSKDGDNVLKCPLDSLEPICDTRERELGLLGFTTLCHCKETDKAAFFSVKSFFKPKKYNSDYANANSFLASEMPGVLATSRIGHYLRVMLRNYIGSFKSSKDIKMLLQNWVAQYVLLNDVASHELKSEFPLKEASIEVNDRPGAPGTYQIDMFLRFHEQFQEATTSLKMVASIPKK